MHSTIVEEQDWVQWVRKAGFRNVNVVYSLTSTKTLLFQIFLISGAISQIIRKITGNRGILNSRIRTVILTKIYHITRKLNESTNGSNIIIVAQK